MTPHEISLLRSSLQKIGPKAEQSVGLFCARLFELDPSLREIFHRDMAEQARKLFHKLGLAVNGLERLDTLAPAARQLGLRHARAHVKARHYETVGEALLWTLAKGLGTDFTLETRIAWGKTYWLLAETLKAGARDGAANLNRAVT